jgi:small conductance mechanosensitive channel
MDPIADDVLQSVDQSVELLQTLIDSLLSFAVEYGFQLLGALVFLFIGLKVASWIGRYVIKLSLAKEVNSTLADFIGMIVKAVIIGMLIIITLGNFGISIGPLIALAGAGAFGATMALQGPLSNYGAGFGIILSRPFLIGNTITVGNISGVVEKIALGVTVLVGEDGEKITVPNKEIVGRVIVNSHDQRVVQTKIAINDQGHGKDVGNAIAAIKSALNGIDNINVAAKPQVGVHDFTYGGVIIGVRFWVPSVKYFQTRYSVNRAIMEALIKADISLLSPAGLALDASSLSGDGEEHIDT